MFGQLVWALLLTTVSAAEDTIDVRVGVVAFGGHADTAFDRARQLFADVEADEPAAFRFHIAAGTHGEVLHWLRRGLIDVAMMTPGVYVQTFTDDGQASRDGRFELLVNKRLSPAGAAWASESRRSPGYHDLCYAVCLVPRSSPFRSIEDIQRAAREQRVKFVFVHPLSVSGRIVPETALRLIGIRPTREQIAYTYSQTESLRLLARETKAQPLVGFVWDDAVRATPELAERLRAIAFPELEKLVVPTNVYVARSDFEHRERLRELLLEHRDPDGEPDLTAAETSRERLDELHRWSHDLGLHSPSQRTQAVSLDEIGRTLLHYAQTQQSPPRLALVLSGGGAKCAYQVGAVAALEEELAALRRANPGAEIDINLVVGTSGGAVNAVPVALGISADAQGREDFRETWIELDQRDLVRPSLPVRALLGIWAALLQAALVLCVARLTMRPQARGWFFCSVLLGLAIVEIVLGYVGWSPWRWLGHQHFWHHVWLVCTFGIRSAAWCLLVLCLIGLLVQRHMLRQHSYLKAPPWLIRWGIIGGLIGLPTLLGITVLFWEETLSSGRGIEKALAEKLPRMVNRHLERQGLPRLETNLKADAGTVLLNVSREIVQGRRLQRDLVLSGSCLEQSTRRALPHDLYFYYRSRPSGPPPNYGEKGISFARHPALLFDVVMGSGSIFPVFPPRTIRNFPTAGDRVELIDGSFAHNSPIEAAVLWGATHIVLIEATPQLRGERNNFLENSAAAFDYLYEQAQTMDTRSRGRVVIFSLAPGPPHLCVLDFADNLVAEAIDKGYREAKGSTLEGQGPRHEPRFRKELGEPVFIDVSPR